MHPIWGIFGETSNLRQFMDYEEYEATEELIERFEEMLKNDLVVFFDVHEFEALADHYMMTGSLKKALLTTKYGVQQHPNAVSLPLKRAQLLAAYNRTDEALHELNRAEGLDPYNEELYISRGMIFSKKGLAHQAIRMFERALELADTPPADVYMLLGNEYQNLKQYEEAIEFYKLALHEDGEDELALYNIAYCYDLIDNNRYSIEFFQEFLEENPYSEIGWYQYAVSWHNEGILDEALSTVEYSILIDDGFAAAYHEKASILEDMEDYEQAINVYKELIELDSPTGISYLKISNIYKRMGNPRAALVYSIKATHEDPQLDEAWMERGLLLDKIGKLSEGIYFIRKATESMPDNVDYQFICGTSNRKMGFLGEAKENFQKVLDLGHIEPRVWINYADLMIELEEYERAMQLLSKGIELNPEDASLNFTYAGYLFLIGSGEEAAGFLENALHLDSEVGPEFLQHFPLLTENEQVQALLNKYQS